jgi:hypothetical protein
MMNQPRACLIFRHLTFSEAIVTGTGGFLGEARSALFNGSVGQRSFVEQPESEAQRNAE